jgi:hypothetical protein
MSGKSVSAQDRADINELFARYAWAGDTGSFAEYVGLFTEDGVFDGVSGYYDGPAELHRLAEEVKDGPRSRGLQHWVGNSVFEAVDDDTVIVKSMCFAPRRIMNEHSLVFVGYYIDTCVRIDGDWKFKIRRWRTWSGDVLDGGRPWETGADDGGYITKHGTAPGARVSAV